MLCQNCGKHNANVKYTQVINGDKLELYLCETCAQKMNINAKFNLDFNFDNIFSGFFNDASIKTLPTQEILKCPGCGLTYSQFADSGKFGCESCYNTFSNRIDNILKKIHGNNRHVGKNSLKGIENKGTTTSIEKKVEKKTELEKLKEELQDCIKKEEYEKAAKIRDKIKEIEKNNNER